MRKLIVLLAVLAMPVPALAEVVIWDNGMDYKGMVSSQWDTAYDLDSIAADDFILEAPLTIVTGVHWIGGYWSFPHDGDFDWEITFYVDDGTGTRPGAIAAGPFRFPEDQCNQTGLPEDGYYDYSVDLADPVSLAADEKYWMSIQGIGDFPPHSGWGFHESILLHMLVFKSVYYGYPDWTDSSEVFDTPYDAAFQLTGIPEPGPLALLTLGGLAMIRRR
jgi:hypothetical protein